MQKSTNNPMRISQESLGDLDDIISDLNSEIKEMKVEGIQIQQTVKAGVQTKQQVNKQKPFTAVKIEKGGKENDSTQSNKQNSIPQTAAKKEQILVAATTTETKAQTTTANSEHKQNQRYQATEESNMFSMTEEEESLRVQQQMPFYMKNGAGAGDEDVESFQRKLDTLIVNFRSETMSEFMRTKKQVLQDQAQTIDAERRRCTTLLGVKQNEIEQLKENLANKTKLSEDLSTRCEALSLWAGTSKTLLRIKLLQHRAFSALRSYRDFKKHSKKMLEHRLRQYRENVKRSVFLGWEQQYRVWKVKKDREVFERAVKSELQNICAQYNKEIESLRDKLNEANAFVENENRNRSLMQENLKKAFMRGVCALNSEAMNILHPSDAAGQIEREMERQMSQAMNAAANHTTFTSMASQRSTYTEQFMNHLSPRSDNQNDLSHNEQVEAPSNPFVSLVSHQEEYKRIDTKDTMWKPAPVMGLHTQQSVVPTFTYVQPTITSQLKSSQQLQAPVLPSTFKSFSTDTVQVLSNNSASHPLSRLEEDTSHRIVNANPTVINNASSLPDFVHNGNTNNDGVGKAIHVPKTINATTPALKGAATGKKYQGITTTGTAKKIAGAK